MGIKNIITIIMKEPKFRPKKRLGQNSLVDPRARLRIIDACAFSPDDIVLEIGAGFGVMTALIAEVARKLVALEIDPQLYKALSDSFATKNNVSILRQDILKFDLGAYFKDAGQKIKVFGNIPYYITTPIIEHLLEHRNIIDSVFIMVQKEFAQRAVVGPGTKVYGSLSCFLQYYTIPEILFNVKKNSFKPAPKVDSALLKLKIREVPAVHVNEEELFFKIIRAGFNQRRKTLKNSLKDFIRADNLAAFFKRYLLSADIRAERLSLADFANLANMCEEPVRALPGN